MRNIPLLLLLFITGPFVAVSQPRSANENLNLNELFNKKVDGAAKIFIGPEYIYPPFTKSGSPFFGSDTLSPGWIVYEGHLYDNQNLQWDVQRDFVLIRALNGYSKIILRNEYIDSFYFAGHKIVNVPADPAINLNTGGLYDVLYGGKTQVLVRRKKDTKSQIRDDRVIYEFYDLDKIYIRKKGTYYLVENRKDLLHVLADERAAINRKINKEGLNWKRDFEACVTVAASYYDEINH